MSDSFQQFVAKVQANSFIMDLPQPKFKRGGKEHRVVKRCRLLSDNQLKLLVQLLEGEKASVVVKGETYALWSRDGLWRMQGLKPGSVVHTLTHSSCSCDSFKFRKAECKHMEALKRCVS